MQSIRTIAVIGAGVMGRGVCLAICQTGQKVVLLDQTEEILKSARDKICADARAYRLLAPGFSRNTDDILTSIVFSDDYRNLADADLIIENVTEKLDVKAAVYDLIKETCKPDVLVAANTSAIPITRLAAMTARPENVIGMHFMNPVPLKPVVELIRGYHTSDATVLVAQDFLSSIGKSSVIVRDSPGFVTNRLMMLMINEAIFLLQEGVASAREIDRLCIGCFGHKIGPLATADLIGLDTVLFSIDVLYSEFKDSKYRPCPLLVEMVAAGLRGRKNGKGFFSYQDSGKEEQNVP